MTWEERWRDVLSEALRERKAGDYAGVCPGTLIPASRKRLVCIGLANEI